MSTNNATPAGMVYPTQKSMIAGTPGDAAIQASANRSAAQAQANRAMAGGKFKKKRKCGGGATIPVPQYTMPYESQGGPGSSPNNQIQQNAAISTQGAENSSMDKAALSGGYRKRKTKKGGNSDWSWGCYSGGKKSRKIFRKKSRKNIRKKSRKN